jgi:adenosylcobyric acid synthase
VRGLAKTLMLQGTASSVGKSLLTAALCRIFRRDGLRVAPFKAQNMALNAAVTPAGGEIGRAQAVQAEAAGIAAAVEMNPILLKPEGGMRSQVVILGKAAGSMTWSEYQRMRPELIAIVDDCIARLRREFEVVVIEGAGSPAEINLHSQDLVNMHVAEAAEAPVLLVGDIDRGGVFAHLVGTMELLEARERRRIAGFVINKFRGDRALLKPGLDYLEARCGVPVFGVVPFVERLRVAEEDSVALDDRSRAPGGDEGVLRIAVVRLPGISNYDDFSALEHEPGVSIGYVDSADAIASCDLVIVPGSKNTISDLAWMRRHGFERALAERSRVCGPTLGICGGCQMLGRKIEDPYGVESREREAAGLGLLPIVTRFERDKRTTQVRAAISGVSFFGFASGAGEIDAYEIHMGRTLPADGMASPFRILSRNGEPCDAADGAIGEGGATVGTMLHGIFENDGLRRAMLASLRQRRGMSMPLEARKVATREAEYDRLAAAVRESLEMDRIRRIAGIS